MKITTKFILAGFLVGCLWINSFKLSGQNPNNITLTNPPVNQAVDSYTRAQVSINLKPGFKYGAVSGAATNLLNLNISALPSFVSNHYSSINNPYLSCQGTIDLSKVVGETEGNFSVSKTGAAVYTIPIFRSPGTNNVAPDVSVFYNSQSGIGLLGFSCHLQANSAISRMGRIPMNDGSFTSVELALSDHFSLDGSKLVLTSGTHGANNAIYRTEVETYVTITAHNQQGQGPQWFELKTSAGVVMEFGNTTDSRTTGSNNNTVLTWKINKCTDVNGNYITYSYGDFQGENVLQSIQYTGNTNAGLQPYNSIVFSYIPLAEKTTNYVNSVVFKKAALLKSIISRCEGVVARTYTFDYEWNNKKTILKKITEADAQGNELNGTEICWGDLNDYPGYQNTQSAKLFANVSDYTNLKSVISADINGDGFSDAVCLYKSPIAVKVQRNGILPIFGTPLPNQSVTFANVLTDNTYYPSHQLHALLGAYAVDDDFDNVQDVYTITKHNSPTNYSIDKITSGSISNHSFHNHLVNPINSAFSPSQFIFNKADYDGDGLIDELIIDPELVSLSTAQGVFQINIPNPNTVTRPLDLNGDGTTEFISYRKVNNDMDVEFTLYKMNKFVHPHVYNAISVFTIPFLQVFSQNTAQKNYLNHISFGDFNGDQNIDMAYMNGDLDELYVMHSDGTGFLPSLQITSFIPINPAQGSWEFVLNCNDLNNDGKSDITITNDANNVNSPLPNYFTYYSIGDNSFLQGPSYKGRFTYTAFEYQLVEKTGFLKYETKTYTGGYASGTKLEADYNGDGYMDILSVNDPATDAVICNNASGTSNLAVNTIYTGLKRKIEIGYGNILNEIYLGNGSNKEEVYRNSIEYFIPGGPPQTPFNHPFYKYKPNLFCVHAVSSSSGYNYQIVKQTRYFYENAILHTLGRGFLGFEKIYNYDPETKIGNVITNDFSNSLQMPFATLDEGYTFQPWLSTLKAVPSKIVNVLLRKTEKQYSIVNLANTKFINHHKTIFTDFVNSQKYETDITYDVNNSGKALSSTTNFRNWTGTLLRTESDVNTYVLVAGLYKINSITSSKTQIGESPYVRSKQFNYDGQGRLLSIVNDPTFGNQSLQIGFSGYNAFGQAHVKTSSAGDILSRSNQIFYDSKGRFITKEISEIGDVLEYNVEPIYGNIIEEKGITGLTIRKEYDGLGRISKLYMPNNAINRFSIQWDDPSNSYYQYTNQAGRLGVYSVRSEIESKPVTKSYYAANLLLREETQSQNGMVNVDYKYNNHFNPSYAEGCLLEKTEAHYNSQTNYLVTLYDYETTLYRKSKEDLYLLNQGSYVPKNLSTIYKYNNFSTSSTYNYKYEVTQDQLGNQNINEYNTLGQKVKSRNIGTGNAPSQRAEYSYASNGEPKSVDVYHNMNPQAVTTAFGYDQLGKQNSINDPSAGNYLYEFNSIGEMTKCTKPGNQITQFTYDLIGRLTSKIGPSGTSSYQYVSSSAGKNKIQQIVGPNSITDFKYDNNGALIEGKETIGNKTFLSEYSVDKYGRTIEHKFPSGFVARYTYDGLDNLNRITDGNNSTIWQLGTKTACGEIVNYTFGNGISVMNTIDDLHYSIQVDYNSICKQTYAYDAQTANLKSRSYERYYGGFPILKEDFTYDGLDRLKKTEQVTAIGNNFIQANNLNFDDQSNITHKDDAGDYHYANPTSPYQLTSMSNLVNNVSLNTLNVFYNDLDKVSQITELGTNNSFQFIYGNDNQRIRMDYISLGNIQYSRYYADNYDLEETLNGSREWTYIYAPSGLCAIHYNNNGLKQLLYTVTDHLGSPLALLNSSQNVVEEASFDSWGRRRNSSNWSYSNINPPTIMIRGYVSHEHLDEVGLINMNGRVYDQVLGRFIQPDAFIQDPQVIANFNRYAYSLNNPLKYSDPSGNWIGIVSWPMGFLSNLLGNLIEGGHENPFQSAVDQTNWFFNTMNEATKIPVFNNGSTQVSLGLDVFAMGISVSASHQEAEMGVGVSFGVGISGFNASGSISYQSSSGFGISLGGGAGSNTYSYGGSVNYNGSGIGYYQTHYGSSSNNPSGSPNPQTVGGITLFGKNWSARMENDFLAGTGDKWRTGAFEVSVGKFSVGFTIYTNEQTANSPTVNTPSPIHGANNRPRTKSFGTWENGLVYDAPIWFGYNTGMGISRIGYSHKYVQDLFQNGIHKWIPFGHQNYYLKYVEGINHGYGYNGFYNQFTLYGK
jgi:RHS repeat-associated protein